MDNRRRHDIDALRILAFALLILYHSAMVYVADWGFHIKSDYTAEWLQWPMIALNRWRMPLLFMISGIAIGLTRAGDHRLRFAATRSWRLLLPLIFGMFVVVPPQTWIQIITQFGYAGGFSHFYKLYVTAGLCRDGQCLTTPTWNHLWYLAYLWPYTMLLLVLMPALRRMRAWMEPRARSAIAGWLLVVAPAAWMIFVQLWLMPRYPESHALLGDWTVHAESLPLFLLGYLLAASQWFWTWVERRRWKTLVAAVLAISLELGLRWLGGHPPADPLPEWTMHVSWGAVERIGRASYTWLALLAIFGWGRVLLDKPFHWLPYCTEAIFPWYVLHQTLIIAIAFMLIPKHLGPVVEPLLVVAGTIAGCLLLHECLIRRIGWLRPLFGLKRRSDLRQARDATPSIALPRHPSSHRAPGDTALAPVLESDPPSSH
ncbi:acyltransferase family protein [Solilutibacter silvestris]|uniref:Acyltransferase family protein n=1 Tax=Solilutibacter silvestris TaxID=1645665 RepID=A0A2K1PZI9_9GAMM|nr:acyltransferase family protein [Lysobacter silvestris]PNS08087.1 Acyltransferase family protein [Lysobacter silvestris]